MLEVKNLSKTYRSKGGVITKALDNVSVKFPSTGLVFLLGKSGSGKSTLLNMIGGLDIPDSGEIIVKGRSSKNFSQSDFDSYRNTYIGFIFQEYNVLEEFNIEQNIALALQLQGKKYSKEEVNKLLIEVDLEGFNKRKPNTLSGGQKQRIAIARALIKSPEIIMADEPTGALDSVTGRQVLETLKKLSKNKLVIVVSHDQDFAEEFGDRIIELMDGKIISDKTKEHVPPTAISNNIEVINGNIIDIKVGSDLTDAEIKRIASIIRSQNKEVMISTGDNNIKNIKKAQRITTSNHGERFIDTKQNEIKTVTASSVKFIRSHLPFSRSFKMGASGLKTKPIRLFFTILLSVTSFTLFGVASTFMFYNPTYSVYRALEGSERKSEALVKNYYYTNENLRINAKTGEKVVTSSYDSKAQTAFGENEIKELNSGSDRLVLGVFDFSTSHYSSSIPIQFIDVSIPSDSRSYYAYTGFGGISDTAEKTLKDAGYHLTGYYPTKKDEIAISYYHYEMFQEAKLFGENISTPQEAVDAKAKLGIYFYGRGNTAQYVYLTITGIYTDFEEIPSKYLPLKQAKPATQSTDERRELENAFKDYIVDSIHVCGFAHPSFYEEYGYVPTNSTLVRNVQIVGAGDYISYEEAQAASITTETTRNAYIYDYVKDNLTYYDLDLNPTSKITLNKNEVLACYDRYHNQYIVIHYLYPITNLITPLQDALSSYYPDGYYFANSVASYSEEGGEYAKAYERINDYVNSGLSYYASGYSYATDASLLKTELTKYYQKAVARSYITRAIDALSTYFEQVSSEEMPTNWESYYKIQEIPHMTDTEFDNFANEVKVLYNSLTGKKEFVILYAMGSTTYYALPSRLWEETTKKYNYSFKLSSMMSSIGDDSKVTAFKEAYESMIHDYYGLEETISYEFNTKFIKTDIINKIDLPTKVYLKDSSGTIKEYPIKGFVSYGRYSYNYSNCYTRETLQEYIASDQYLFINQIKSDYQAPSDAKYTLALAITNYSQHDVDLFTKQYDLYRYDMTNTRYQAVTMWTETIKSMNQVFLIVGAVLGALSTLLLLNFISVSISNKSKDIGILRAVGARGSDVFKIFFSESSIISFICFLLSSVASGVVCYFLNESIKNSALGIYLIDFGLINIGCILALTAVIGFIATIIPVAIAARKPPVEAIRAL